MTPANTTGKIAQLALDEVNITTNKNRIPYDPKSAFVTSGVRLGTPATTTRGMGEAEMVEIGNLIALIIKNLGNETVYEEVRQRVAKLVAPFPVPGIA
jgi:glycine hydroxymethyltransferase